MCLSIFKTVPPVDFALKIKEVTAKEREDAIFECVLTQPVSKITWTLKNTPLSNNEKYEITCSEDKLVHSLRIIDCLPLDAGIYAAIAGLKSSSAWLIVEGKYNFFRLVEIGPINEIKIYQIKCIMLIN